MQIRKVAAGGDSVALDQERRVGLKYLAVDSSVVYFTDIAKVFVGEVIIFHFSFDIFHLPLVGREIP